MSARGNALLVAQLKAHGGQVLPNQADGHNVYAAGGRQVASIAASTAGQDGGDHARRQLRDVLTATVSAERMLQDRYTVERRGVRAGWVTIRDTNLGRDVASCDPADAPALLAGLVDFDITQED